MKQKVPKCKGINLSFMNDMLQFPVFGQYIFKKAKSSQIWTQSRFGDASFIYIMVQGVFFIIQSICTFATRPVGQIICHTITCVCVVTPFAVWMAPMGH